MYADDISESLQVLFDLDRRKTIAFLSFDIISRAYIHLETKKRTRR